jgi:UPF0755 protein
MSLSEVLPGAFPPGEQPTRRRGAARQQRKRRKRRRRNSIVIILLTIGIVGGAVAGSYVFGLAPLIKRLSEPKDYTGAGSGKIVVQIPDGATGRAIAVLLAKDDVVKTESAFLDAVEKDPRAKSIQPGTYGLRKQMSGSSALSLLLDPKAKLTLSVTIPEGTRAKDTLAKVAKVLKLKPADLKKASTSGKIGLPKAANGNLEGFLFPDTYQFEPDVTAEQVLTAMVKRGSEVFAALDIPKAQLRNVVIKASIVQAEAGNKKYMGPVARVLDNRLKIKMKLSLDSTVSYATGKFNITTTAADRASSSPFNTYRYVGLPAGPISNPGEEALRAVLDPTPGPWLYFVTTNPSTGETKFATTYAGHLANNKEFQAWLRAHPQSK